MDYSLPALIVLFNCSTPFSRDIPGAICTLLNPALALAAPIRFVQSSVPGQAAAVFSQIAIFPKARLGRSKVGNNFIHLRGASPSQDHLKSGDAERPRRRRLRLRRAA